MRVAHNLRHKGSPGVYSEADLKARIKVFENAGLSAEEEKAKLAQIAKDYPSVMSLPELEWLIEGILAKKGITIIGGLTDAGKTTIALQLCHSLFTGEPFLGIAVSGKVDCIAYACLDQSPAMLHDQVKKMLPILLCLEKLKIIPELVWNGERIEGLDDAVNILQPQVVVIDALNALMGTADENVAVGPLMRELRRVTEGYDISLIIPHQFRKPLREMVGKSEPTAQDFRGSTEIGAKADVLLALQRNGLEVKLTSVKAKSSRKTELNLCQDPETLIYQVSITSKERISELLAKGTQPSTVIQIVHTEFGGNEGTIKSAVYREVKRRKG